jgi:FkbM family methyltransferase
MRFLIFGFLLCSFNVVGQLEPFYFEGNAQGTTFHITYYDSLERDFQIDVLTILDDFDQSLSTYIPTSIISRINQGEENVKTITIDSLNLEKLDLIKLDVQGFELKTLLGGEKTIKNNYPLMFIENYIDQESDQQVIKLLEEWGYVIYRLLCTESQEDCIMVIPEKHKNEINFIETQTLIKWKK